MSKLEEEGKKEPSKIKMNDPMDTEPMTIKLEELRRCAEGHGDMSGEEYYFYHYCRINGKLPKPGTFKKDFHRKGCTEEQQKNWRVLKSRRSGPRPLLHYYPLTKDAWRGERE
ncbi:hypothetical protein PP178_03885 [Zeaxanthinibacter sp. PT1]|uniref:hypothetical protein n=1 Tax=Zeaxanthinibacter TaxID=561554 RepID=UPI00234BED57|nr:hypothetical protein [Zeaxanthinibacter sp. PT1]MDC6350680.1 hypothetical protein [Zeaxanthinibacter sp. PT1]